MARVICIQIHGAAPRNANGGIGFFSPHGGLKREQLRCPQMWLNLGLSFLLTPGDAEPEENATTPPQERLSLLIFRSGRAPADGNAASERSFMPDLCFVDISGGGREFLLAACPHGNWISRSRAGIAAPGVAPPAESSASRAAKDCKTSIKLLTSSR